MNEFHRAKHEKECPIGDFKTERTCPVLPLDILILAEDGLATALEKSANSMFIEITHSSNHRCNKVKGLITEKYQLNDLIVFKISANVNISNITNTIVLIENKKYCIVSAIEFVPGCPGGLGHYSALYKAHCKSGAKW